MEIPQSIFITDANALILSDTHFNYHNAGFLELALKVGQRRWGRIPRIIHAGDAFYGTGMSNHPDQKHYIRYSDEVKVTRENLLRLSDLTDELLFLTGNHDAWFAYKMENQMTTAELIDSWGIEIRVSEYQWLEIGSWLVCHPENYSSMPGGAARGIAEVERKNVIGGHTHLWGEGKTKDGLLTYMEIGCCCTEEMPYKKFNKSNKPRWVNGFALLEDDIAYLYDKQKALREIS